MTEGKFVMVLIIEDVDEVSVERMDLLNLGELFKNTGESIVDGFFTEFDLPHVE